jgi:hypothetical protein
MATKIFAPKQEENPSRYQKVGNYQVPERLVELEAKESITVDEYREILINRQSMVLDYSDTLDGWNTGVYDLPFAELIPLGTIRYQYTKHKGRQSKFDDMVWCYYTAMTMELPTWRVEQLLRRRSGSFRPNEAMRVYDAAQGLMEDCGLC